MSTQGDVNYDLGGGKTISLNQLLIQNTLDAINIDLNWGSLLGDDIGVRTETYNTSATNTAEPMKVYMLGLKISNWSEISSLSPKIRVERYRRQGKRGTVSKKRLSGFKFTESPPNNRPTVLDIKSDKMILDIAPERYFRISKDFPRLSGGGRSITQGLKSRKQLIQFRIEITKDGVTYVSKPLKQIKIIASRVESNYVSYTYV